MEILRNSRIMLRDWQLSDATNAFEIYGDPEVSKYIGNGKPAPDIAHVEKIIAKFIEHQKRFGFSPWAVIDIHSHKIVRVCGLHTFNDEGEPELGFRFHRSHWGRGLASEASLLVLGYGFTNLKLPRIAAFTSPANKATQKLLSKVGFSLTGPTLADGHQLLRFDIQNG